MKQLTANLKTAFTPYGYRKSRNSFWKIENGFYKLIDFQQGAYGDYFFINVALHPVGLPSLVVGKLEIKERPREYECILRQRMGEIVPAAFFKKALIPSHDADTIPEIAASLPAAEAWLAHWGSFEVIAGGDPSELSGMMPIAPILWQKACHMLKCYCLLKQGNLPEARNAYAAYLSENRDMDFLAADRYLEALLEGALD